VLVEAGLVLPAPAVRAEDGTDRHPAIAPRAVLTELARQWAFEQVGERDAAVAAVAAVLGVAWWTVMDQVIARGTPLIEDPARLDPPSAPVTAAGVDETAFLRATGTHPTLFATGITDLTPGRSPRLLDVVEGRSGTVLGWLAERDPAWRAEISTASLDPFRGYATALATHLPQAERVLDRFTSCASAWPASTTCVAACSRRPPGAGAAPPTRSTASAECCAAAATDSPARPAPGCRPGSSPPIRTARSPWPEPSPRT
jgi:hypothetical protein